MLAPDQPLDRSATQIPEDRNRQPHDLGYRRAFGNTSQDKCDREKTKAGDTAPKPEPKLAPRRAVTPGVLLGHPFLLRHGGHSPLPSGFMPLYAEGPA